MVTKQLIRKITKQQVGKTRNLILLEKLQDTSFYNAGNLNSDIKDYYTQLSEEFNKFIFYHMERATNGFRRKTLKNQLKELSLIRPAINEIAGLDNPNHPYVGIARELAEQTFYELQKIYSST